MQQDTETCEELRLFDAIRENVNCTQKQLESRIQMLEGIFPSDCSFMNNKMLPLIPYNEGFDFGQIRQLTLIREKPGYQFMYEPLLQKYIKKQLLHM